MNPIDRFQAIIRHPDYRNDPRLKDGKTFELENWTLRRMLEQKHLSTESEREWWQKLIAYECFLFTWGLKHAVDPEDKEQVQTTIKALSSDETSIFILDSRELVLGDFEGKFDGKQGPLLQLTVNLETPTRELLNLIQKMIEKNRKERGIRTKRSKSFGINPWEVWDKMQLPSNSLLKITRAHFKITKNPAYDENAKQAYETVRRAYKKACSLIEEVGSHRIPSIMTGKLKKMIVNGILAMLDEYEQELRAAAGPEMPFAESTSIK